MEDWLAWAETCWLLAWWSNTTFCAELKKYLYKAWRWWGPYYGTCTHRNSNASVKQSFCLDLVQQKEWRWFNNHTQLKQIQWKVLGLACRQDRQGSGCKHEYLIYQDNSLWRWFWTIDGESNGSLWYDPRIPQKQNVSSNWYDFTVCYQLPQNWRKATSRILNSPWNRHI